MNPTRAWMIPAVAALALLTASCGSDSPGGTAETVPADSSQVEASPEETAAAPETTEAEEPTADAKVAVEEAELDGALLDSFPSDVPLYDGEIESSKSGANSFGDGEWNVMMTSDDPLETVDARIREDYSSNGWQISSEMEFAGGYQLVARSDSYIVSLTYNDMMINYGVSALG